MRRFLREVTIAFVYWLPFWLVVDSLEVWRQWALAAIIVLTVCVTEWRTRTNADRS
jgi:hypothetical protein